MACVRIVAGRQLRVERQFVAGFQFPPAWQAGHHSNGRPELGITISDALPPPGNARGLQALATQEAA
eukprot:7375940-Prymnesium_polylepis.2